MFPVNNLFHLTLFAYAKSNEHTNTYDTICFLQTKALELQQTIYGFAHAHTHPHVHAHAHVCTHTYPLNNQCSAWLPVQPRLADAEC